MRIFPVMGAAGEPRARSRRATRQEPERRVPGAGETRVKTGRGAGAGRLGVADFFGEAELDGFGGGHAFLYRYGAEAGQGVDDLGDHRRRR